MENVNSRRYTNSVIDLRKNRLSSINSEIQEMYSQEGNTQSHFASGAKLVTLGSSSMQSLPHSNG